MKHLVVLSGYVMVALLTALFVMGADRVVVVPCGQDLDAIVNTDDPTIGTRFQLEGPCTYPVDTTVILKEGDELAGPPGSFTERYPAFDPGPTVEVVGGAGVVNVVAARDTVRVEWVKIVGGTGQYLGGSPLAGTGSGLAMGMASDDSSLYAVHITGSDAAGITNAHGTFERIELDDTTQDPNFLGFTGSGLKATTEVEVRNSYIHDNQGNGLWCDVYCHDSVDHPNGFWVHDNLVVKNGRAGIRFEQVGDVADSGEALIEYNEVHQNSQEFTRGGIDIRDAWDALVRNNVFGAKSIAGVAYRRNASGLAIRATDSGRSDRPDLWNVDIGANALNGETIVGCQKPDHIVDCQADSSPRVISASPKHTATGVAPSASLTASFSEKMDPASITNSTFNLFKITPSGATRVTNVTVSLSTDRLEATLNPFGSTTTHLSNGTTYKGVVTTEARDEAGNRLDQHATTTGFQQKAWTFTVSD